MFIRNISISIISLMMLNTQCFDKVTYQFSLDPIDVVIPCHKKDLQTLDLVIQGIKKNIQHRRIIIISSEPLTQEAEWFNEAHFPFSKKDIAYEILKNEQQAKEFINHPKTRIGWIYQQFLKLYAPLVIPDISPNVLIVDADTIFLHPVTFQDPSGAPLFNVGKEHIREYFEHITNVLPGIWKRFPDKSGICHHMLIQKPVLVDLFSLIEDFHGVETWKALCSCMDHNVIYKSCMSEYELYFNFIFARCDQAHVRTLRWRDLAFKHFGKLKKEKYDYVSCHAWIR